MDFGGLLICYTRRSARRSAMLYGRTKNSVAICFGLSHFLSKLTGLERAFSEVNCSSVISPTRNNYLKREVTYS